MTNWLLNVKKHGKNLQNKLTPYEKTAVLAVFLYICFINAYSETADTSLISCFILANAFVRSRILP